MSDATTSVPQLVSTEELDTHDHQHASDVGKRRLGSMGWHSPWVTRARYNPLIRRCWAFLRGPLPPLVFTGPTPYLNSALRIGAYNLSLALESKFTNLTSRLTSRWLFLIFCGAYLVALAFLVRAQAFLIPAESSIGCTATYWLPDEGCGLDGVECLPFANTTFDFKCPAQCQGTILQNPRAVGALEPVFVPLVVGGGTPKGELGGVYRGDSFICAAAIHAGVINNPKGGCGRVTLIGNYTNFTSSTANGLTSTPFPSVFPISFLLSQSDALTHCNDLRDEALAFNILITVIVFLFLRPPSLWLFWSLVCIGFWHVTFFSEPRAFPPPISDAFGSFLPAIFVALAFWKIAWCPVLTTFSNIPLERAFWYLLPFWAGVEFNVITEKIPIDRLVASDLSSRPGAITALVVIVLIIFALVLNQLRYIRKAGLLLIFAKGYVAVGIAILILSQMPGLQFRLHHYFAAILLTPLTILPTRLSAIYQAFILGIFLNGVAAFGFAPIFQTKLELVRDGSLGTGLPTFISSTANWNASAPLEEQIVSWMPLSNDTQDWDAFSLMVDDVERVAADAANYSLSTLKSGIDHFFRLAYSKNGVSGDYTRAATLYANGSWLDPLPGPAS